MAYDNNHYSSLSNDLKSLPFAGYNVLSYFVDVKMRNLWEIYT